MAQENSSHILFLVFAFLLPVLFIPGGTMPLDFFRQAFINVSIIVLAIVWLISRLQKESVSFSKNALSAGMAGLFLSAALSAFFSGNIKHSLVGMGFELDTVLFISLLIIVSCLAYCFLDNKKKILAFFLTVFSSSAVILVYSYLRVVLSPFMQERIWFLSLPPSLIGKWNELAILFGLLSLSTAMILDLTAGVRERKYRISLFAVLTLSLGGLVFINFYPVWIMLGVFSLVLYIYALLSDRTKVFKSSLFIIIIAVVFILSGRFGGPLNEWITRLNDRVGVPRAFSIEPRPGIKDTAAVAKGALIEKPIFGVGPNNFNYAWSLYKPASFNSSLAWSADFDMGSGFLPSILVNQGVLGVVALLLFAFGLLSYSRKVIKISRQNKNLLPVNIASLFILFYLLIFSVIYPLGGSLLVLTFIMIGLNLSLGRELKIIKPSVYNLSDNPKLVIVHTLFTSFLILAAVAGGYFYVGKIWANSIFFKGISIANNTGNLNQAEEKISKAVNNDLQDLYLRTLSNLYVLKISGILSNKSLSREEVQGQFIQNMKLAIDTASSSVALNPNNYQNFITLGGVYEAAASYGVAGGREQAVATYEKARTLNPESPLTYFLAGRVEAISGNLNKVKENLQLALTKKEDYPEAILLLSQTEAQGGNFGGAAAIAEKAFVVAPNDLNVLFQLGYLKYKSEAYEEARLVLERARAISPNYSNGKYFLGLTYDRLGEIEKAIREFTDIQKLNPNNQEVKNILNNLRSGLPALYSITSEFTPPPSEKSP